MGAQVFLTGVTGFVGKVVLETLLRRKNELALEKVYILIRPRGKTPAEERFEAEVQSSACFKNLAEDWAALVEVIPGDLVDLHLDTHDHLHLQQNITHIIHCAASVAFDLPIQEAAEANITSALNLMAFAKTCKRLKSFVDVSTAYVTPHSGRDELIPEALVPLSKPATEIYQGICDGSLQEAELLKNLGHPNTYTLTKCLSEHLLYESKEHVPLAIVRPSIISASWRYPFPGWIDSYAAFAGFVGLIGAGILKCVVARDETVLDLVPCDEVALGIVETAFWPEGQPPLIQHIVSGVNLGSRIDICIAGIENYFQRHPVRFWPRITHISNKGSLGLGPLRNHTLPALLASLWYRLQGNSKKRRQVAKVQEKIKYLNDAFPYFTHYTFRFAISRPISFADFEPRQYIERVCRGVHQHLMQNRPEQLLLGGADHRHPLFDFQWARLQPRGNWAIRTAAYIVRKALRRSNDQITFDRESFEQALAKIPPERLLVLVPSHRSYMDFLLCSYLVFAHPELNIAIPKIAAASDFSKIPFLGWFFQQAHAFYIKRGQGKADPDLTRRIEELVNQNQTLEFFIEGTRSRSRQFLPPRRGILRALQNTGVNCSLLPISISYDLVPEAGVFLKELKGGKKPRMRLSGLLRWSSRLLLGKVKLGRVHLTCGQPLEMQAETDVYQLSTAIMSELQKHTVVSTLHLKAFLKHHPLAHVDLTWLETAIQERGGQIIQSSMAELDEIDPIIEQTMRYQWMPYFYPDLLAFHTSPAFQYHIEKNAFLPELKQPRVEGREDAALQALLEVLFYPLAQTYTEIMRQALNQEKLPAAPRNLVAGKYFLPHVEEVLETLQAGKYMQPDSHGQLIPGPNWRELPDLLQACAWPIFARMQVEK